MRCRTEWCVYVRDVCLPGRFTSAVVYQGLIMRLGILGGNVYIDFLISGLVEFPAAILILFTIDRIGRRLPFAAANIVSGAACLITAFIPESEFYPAACSHVCGKGKMKVLKVLIWTLLTFRTECHGHVFLHTGG